jgi:lysophospholipase L1-like esterase
MGSSFGVALLLAELALRIVYRDSMDFDMEMWKYATQVKMPSADPRVAFEHAPRRSAQLMGVRVVTNDEGMRDRPRSKVKQAGEFRIANLGDSVTMGWGVEQTATYPAELERLLNRRPPRGFPENRQYTVLNFGVGNYNTVQEVALMKRRVVDFDPDLVIVGYFINDAEPTPSSAKNSLLENSYTAAFLMSRARLLRPTFGDYRSYYRDLYAADRQAWLNTISAFHELGALSRDLGIPTLVAILPEMHQPGPDYPFRDVHRLVERELAAAGLIAVDLAPAFEAGHPPSSLWVSALDAHPNARAQAQLARGLFDGLEARASLLLRAGPAPANRVR